MSDPKDLLELQFEVQKYWASSLIVPTSQACVSIKSLLLFFSPEQAGFSHLFYMLHKNTRPKIGSCLSTDAMFNLNSLFQLFARPPLALVI